MDNDINVKVEHIFKKLYGDKNTKTSVSLFSILIECGLWPRPIDRERLVCFTDGKDTIRYYLTNNTIFEKLPENHICWKGIEMEHGAIVKEWCMYSERHNGEEPPCIASCHDEDCEDCLIMYEDGYSRFGNEPIEIS